MKTFNDFHSLQEDLKSAGFLDVPLLPGKTLFSVNNEAGLVKRRNELQLYLNQLLENKVWRNSPEVVRFLELHKFTPELLVSHPQLLMKGKERNGFVVT